MFYPKTTTKEQKGVMGKTKVERKPLERAVLDHANDD
jgi:hypothetical protein